MVRSAGCVIPQVRPPPTRSPPRASGTLREPCSTAWTCLPQVPLPHLRPRVPALPPKLPAGSSAGTGPDQALGPGRSHPQRSPGLDHFTPLTVAESVRVRTALLPKVLRKLFSGSETHLKFTERRISALTTQRASFYWGNKDSVSLLFASASLSTLPLSLVSSPCFSNCPCPVVHCPHTLSDQ